MTHAAGNITCELLYNSTGLSFAEIPGMNTCSMYPSPNINLTLANQIYRQCGCTTLAAYGNGCTYYCNLTTSGTPASDTNAVDSAVECLQDHGLDDLVHVDGCATAPRPVTTSSMVPSPTATRSSSAEPVSRPIAFLLFITIVGPVLGICL
jgi:hypothetical protein